MIYTAKNNKNVLLRKLQKTDIAKLHTYLQGLSYDTTRRYGPHPFDLESVKSFYKNADHWGFVAENTENGEIVAYAIIKKGYITEDYARYASRGINLNQQTDCTYAPSVADAWQNCGTGNALYHFILSDIKEQGFKRIILWGGVQACNEKAVNFYRKNGFIFKGEFFHNVNNYDMIREI
jgi:diamine N-acetyltransferase